MSQLAQALATVESVPANERKGPVGACSVYGPGDDEDWRAIEALRAQGVTWGAVQALVDEQLKITRPIKPDLFRYHWRRQCAHWDSK